MKQHISNRFQWVIPLLIVIIAILASPSSAKEPPKTPPDLNGYMARVMKAFRVPGVGLAIVHDGRVIMAEGFGVLKMGESTPVNEKTLFCIASNSKAFTATAIALLVEEGKIRWDVPVINYLPWFQLWDPYVTRELTVRDLLVHRSGLGLGAGDLLWWPASNYTRKEIARRLRFIPPATSFRSAYAYDNVLYLVAGEVIEAVSGQTWEDFVSARILKRVGMTGSSVTLSTVSKAANFATPHAEIEGVVRPVKAFDSNNTNPAGGICSNAEDMAKWLLVQLNEGRLSDGSRLFSERSSRELMTIVTPMPIGDPPEELHAQRMDFRGYGLGFGIHDYRGKKVVTHTGGLPGFLSKLTMIPELELGVMVITNQESGAAFNAITYHILDYYLGVPEIDWMDAYLKFRKRQKAAIAESEKKAASARDASSSPSLPLERYAGIYNDAWYGNIEILNENGKLVMRFTQSPSLIGDLEHWQYDTFVVRWRDRELRADAFVTFALNPDGSIAQAKMQPASPAVDFSFDFQDLLLKPVSERSK